MQTLPQLPSIAGLLSLPPWAHNNEEETYANPNALRLASGRRHCRPTLHAQDSPVTIGASLPLSGAQAEAGKEGLSIMQAQVEAFNKLGGLGASL